MKRRIAAEWLPSRFWNKLKVIFNETYKIIYCSPLLDAALEGLRHSFLRTKRLDCAVCAAAKLLRILRKWRLRFGRYFRRLHGRSDFLENAFIFFIRIDDIPKIVKTFEFTLKIGTFINSEWAKESEWSEEIRVNKR